MSRNSQAIETCRIIFAVQNNDVWLKQSVRIGYASNYYKLGMERPEQPRFVLSHRDADYCINISQWYCSHWEAIHALRQALQNWQDAVRTKYAGRTVTIQLFQQPALGIYTFHPMIDGAKSQLNWIQFDEHEKTIVMGNEGSFKIQNMLMGASSNKANNQLALGQFGEGMKLYLLILLKKGFPVFIESGDLYYGPSLKRWQYEYDNGRVLYMHTKKRSVVKENTVVTIHNVSKEMFDQFRYLSLSLVKDYSVISYGKMSLIISNNPLLQGKIFKKGILVGMRYNCDSPYSYDFDDIVLGRDRDSINDPQQLKHLQSQIHAYVLNNHETLQNSRPDILDQLPKHLAQVVRGLKRNAFKTYYLHAKINKPAADRIYRYFLKENNTGELYPLHTTGQEQSIHQNLSNYGLPASFYPKKSESWSYCHNLYKSGFYQSIVTKISKQIKVGRALNDAQKDCLLPLVNNIAICLPQIRSYQFLIFELEKIPCYKEPGKKIITINKTEMQRDPQLFKMKMMELLLKDILK